MTEPTDSTADSGPRRKELLTAELADSPAIQRVQVSRVELLPGQAPGAHHHPCNVVGTIVEGSVRYQLAGHPETMLRAGDAFLEPRDAHVLHFDNASDTEPAAFLACYLLAPGQTELIVLPQ